jgi:hypothetical protein
MSRGSGAARLLRRRCRKGTVKNVSGIATCLFVLSLGCASTSHTDNVGDDAATGGILPTTPTGDGGTSPINVGDGSVASGALTITPNMPVVTVIAGKPVPTVQFAAFLRGTKTGAVWSIDHGELGTIDNSGLFTPVGTVGGTGTVTAAQSGQTGATTITVNIQTTQQGDPSWSSPLPPPGAGGYGGVGGDGPGGPPSAAQMTAFGGTPTADPTVSWIYPYDGTVWPQGLVPPLLQWNPGTHTFDAVYVHIQENGFEYKGYFAANAMPFKNIAIPRAVWDTATLSNGGDPMTVSLVFAQGSGVFGPYTESWTIAHATLQGNIYYNSYGTTLVKNSATDGLDSYGKQYGAATLSITPGATAPTLTAGINSINATGNGTGCRVCHTVSANGKTLVTQASDMTAGDYSNTVYINLAGDTTGGAGTPLATRNLAFPALFKDGSLLFSSSGGMINGDTPTSQLYALPMGTPVAGVTGLPAGLQAALPAFSPDGQHVSFNFWGGTFGAVPSDKISLALIDFDGKTAFSNPRVLYKPPPPSAGGEQPSATFSSFLPDSTGVVFDLELHNAAGWAHTWQQNTSELWWVDVSTGTAHRLDQLNGYDKTGKLYLPDNARGKATHTAAEDATLNYEPTVCPIAGGGYAWIVFTSRRMYGSVAEIAPWVSDPRQYPWLDPGQVTDKKLWVAAVDLNAKPGTDPSHPAFYLPAQELHAGNMRGFWSFDKCRPEGASCGSGAQCCGGYCQGSQGMLTCTANVPKCAKEGDKCMKSSDCCGVQMGITCVNNVCSQSHPT